MALTLAFKLKAFCINFGYVCSTIMAENVALSKHTYESSESCITTVTTASKWQLVLQMHSNKLHR
jgi:hypothetical protein